MKKNKISILGSMLFLTLAFVSSVSAQTETDLDTSANFDLQAVAELFKESETIEAFEKALNDSEVGINNLDLNNDGEVDVISITEQIAADTRLLILRVPVAENDFQDAATIAIEKNADQYDLEIEGNKDIYGDNYYVVPAAVNPSGWKIFGWLFRPNYRPYQSVFGYKTYPRWWKPRRAVSVNVYRAATGRFVGRRTFTTGNTRRLRNVTRINYTPRTSSRVVVRKKTVRTNGEKTVVKKGVKVTNTNNSNGNSNVKKVKVVKTKKRGS